MRMAGNLDLPPPLGVLIRRILNIENAATGDLL